MDSGDRRTASEAAPAWRARLGGAAAVALVIAYLVSPSDLWGQWLYQLGTTAASLVMVLAVRHHRPSPRQPWMWLTLGLLATTAGDWTWAVHEWTTTEELPSLIWGDLWYAVAYGAMGIGLVQLIRLRRGGRGSDRAIDVAVVAVIGLVLSWQMVIEPTLLEGDEPVIARLVSSSYPVGDLVLLTLLGWLALVDRRRSASLAALVGAFICWLGADVGYMVQAQTGNYSFAADRAVDGAWIAAAMLLATAAVRRDMTDLVDPPSPGSLARAGPRSAASAVIAGCLVAVPPTIEAVVDGREGEQVNGLIWAASIFLAALVVARAVSLGRARDRLDRYHRAIAANSADGVIIVNLEGVVIRDVHGGAALLGARRPSAVGLGMGLIHDEDKPAAGALLRELVDQPGRAFHTELRVDRSDGTVCWLAVRAINLVQEPTVGGIVVNLHDVTDRHRAEDELRYRAFHDSLTGLANRALFRDRVEHALLRGAGSGGEVPAVIFIDLDGFKSVNDSLGHDGGDELLRMAALRLQGALRDEDTIARLGGDEFAVLIENSNRVAGGAGGVADRLMSALAQPFRIHGAEADQLVFVQASLGVATATGSTDPVALLRDADVAMYRAKATGKGRWVRFEESMRAAVEERTRLDRDLAGALDRHEFRLVYQPVVSLRTGAVTGFEALIRWDHPALGTLSPDRFVPLVEESGAIVPIGLWVLEEACTPAVRWQRAFPAAPPLVMAVNLSARQLRSRSFVADVAAIILSSGIDASALLLEMTETVLVENPAESAVRLGQLRALGVRLALDDFGTGYSSLSYLREFPVDVLKIDRAFVETIKPGEELPAIVAGMLDLGRNLGLELVAEGIEHEEQWERLREEDCHFGQGYLFARPLDEIDAEALVADLVARGAGTAVAIEGPTPA